MTDAYHAGSALEAETGLSALAAELDRTHPVRRPACRGASTRRSPCCDWACRPPLARTLRLTNTIESMISVCREHTGNVKRCRDGQMALRWCAAGMTEARKQFHRFTGHLHLTTLRAAPTFIKLVRTDAPDFGERFGEVVG